MVNTQSSRHIDIMLQLSVLNNLLNLKTLVFKLSLLLLVVNVLSKSYPDNVVKVPVYNIQGSIDVELSAAAETNEV